jgi:hypothetical protein
MFVEGAFALFHENPTSLLPISHATAMPVGERQRWHQRRMVEAAAERIGEEVRSMVPEFLQVWIPLMKAPA